MKKDYAAIVIDLDDTLVDTQALKDLLITLCVELNVEKRHAQGVYKRHSKELFNPRKFAQEVFANPQDRKIFLSAFDAHLEKSVKLFSGVRSFLTLLSKKYTLVLLTYGDKEYQERKIEIVALKKYFAEVITTKNRDKKKEIKDLKKRYGQILVIDDSEIVHESADLLDVPFLPVIKGFKDKKYFEQLKKNI